MSETILEVKHLKTYFFNGSSVLRASDDLSYSVKKGECVAIVGESGSGKSVSALSVMRLIPYPPGLTLDGEILFHGKDLLKLSDEEMGQIRGSKISMIFQEPSTALNPVMTIGAQICESLMIHQHMRKKGRHEAGGGTAGGGKYPQPGAAGKAVPPLNSPAACSSGP